MLANESTDLEETNFQVGVLFPRKFLRGIGNGLDIVLIAFIALVAVAGLTISGLYALLLGRNHLVEGLSTMVVTLLVGGFLSFLAIKAIEEKNAHMQKTNWQYLRGIWRKRRSRGTSLGRQRLRKFKLATIMKFEVTSSKTRRKGERSEAKQVLTHT